MARTTSSLGWAVTTTLRGSHLTIPISPTDKKNVRRPVFEVTGLDGEVSKNHGFIGTGTYGTVRVLRYLCSCRPCATNLGWSVHCERKAYVKPAFEAELAFGAGYGNTDHEASDRRLYERASKLWRHLKPGTIAAIHNVEP